MMKGNINLISYDCYQQATEKQLASLKWKENRVYYVSAVSYTHLAQKLNSENRLLQKQNSELLTLNSR